MIKQKKQSGLKIFLGVFILLMFNILSHSRMLVNGGHESYDDPGEQSSSSTATVKATATSRMAANIIVGGSHFLNSHSYTLLLLSKIEMSDLNGVNYNDLQATLNNAIKHMEGAKEAYTTLFQIAEVTPYNQNVINRLISFDYIGFQEKRGLNSIIFKDVEEYLSNGDVTGLLGEVLSSTGTILEMLYQVKNTIDTDQLPENSTLWRINQKYFEVLLFGQYAAEMFYAVTD